MKTNRQKRKLVISLEDDILSVKISFMFASISYRRKVPHQFRLVCCVRACVRVKEEKALRRFTSEREKS